MSKISAEARKELVAAAAARLSDRFGNRKGAHPRRVRGPHGVPPQACHPGPQMATRRRLRTGAGAAVCTTRP